MRSSIQHVEALSEYCVVLGEERPSRFEVFSRWDDDMKGKLHETLVNRYVCSFNLHFLPVLECDYVCTMPCFHTNTSLFSF